MIPAMPRVVASCSEALYMFVGVTHPKVTGREYLDFFDEVASVCEQERGWVYQQAFGATE